MGRAAGVLAAFALGAGTLLGQARPFALEDIAAFKVIPEVAVAPGGRLVAIVVRTMLLAENRSQSDVWLVPADGSTEPRPLTFDRATERSLRWSPDGTRLAFIADRDGTPQVWALSLAGGEAVKLTSHAEAVAAFDFSADGSQVAFVAPAPKSADEQRRERQRDDGYLLGEKWRHHRLWIAGRQVSDGRLHVRAVAWSPDGSRIAIVTSPTAEADSAEDAKAQIVALDSGETSDVPGGALANHLSWSPDGRRLAFARAFDGRGISREDLHVWDAGSSLPARNLSASLDRDVDDLAWSPDGSTIDVRIAQGVTHAVARIHVGNGATEIVARYPHAIGVWRRTRTGHVFTRTDVPADVFGWSSGGSTQRLTSFNASLAGLQLPVGEAFRWKGPIGELEGVLYKPYGFDATRRYPLIVNPHGGPRDHSVLAFDPAVAYWTSLGYVVLKPNFRGSTGYGDAFTRANVANWGDGPYQDVMTGVDALIARGIADPARLFMYGWSYGGILANWTATHTDRFKAIVSGASVADGRLQYAISDARRWRFDYFGGSPFLEVHDALYRRESPITYAHQAKTPTLFVVGEQDTRCPPEQSLLMYRAFTDHGVVTELLLYPREDHTFVEPRHIVDRARRVAEWYQRFDGQAARRAPTSSGS